MRAMPKKSRNPFLSEKYVEIPACLGGPALEGGGTLCVGGAVRCCAGGGRQGALAERGPLGSGARWAAGTAWQERQEEGGLRPRLLPASRHIPQRAELGPRVEGQRLLKPKVQAFSAFFSIQVLQLFGGCESYFNSVGSGQHRVHHVNFCCCRTWRLGGFLHSLESLWDLSCLASIPAGPHRALQLLLWYCLASAGFGPQTFFSFCPKQNLFSYCHTAHAQPEKDKRKEIPTWARPT